MSLRDVRVGRSVHEVEVTARAGGREVCVARCLRIRTVPVVVASDVPTDRPARSIDDCAPFAFPIRHTA